MTSTFTFLMAFGKTNVETLFPNVFLPIEQRSIKVKSSLKISFVGCQLVLLTLTILKNPPTVFAFQTNLFLITKTFNHTHFSLIYYTAHRVDVKFSDPYLSRSNQIHCLSLKLVLTENYIIGIYVYRAALRRTIASFSSCFLILTAYKTCVLLVRV